MSATGETTAAVIYLPASTHQLPISQDIRSSGGPPKNRFTAGGRHDGEQRPQGTGCRGQDQPARGPWSPAGSAA
jgi:hypothetical protein